MTQSRRRWQSHRAVAERIERIMAIDLACVEQPLGKDAPRSLPNCQEFVRTGWSEHMLFRYRLAMEFCAGLEVLDSCSGLGWGAYRVGAVARSLTGIDLDEASIGFARRQWLDPKLGFFVGSVLDQPFDDARFDAVLCMEAIEHFTLADGVRYLNELRRVCRVGGVIVGSSTFPDTRVEAQWLCRSNRHDLYTHTRRGLRRLLQSPFGPPLLLTRHSFVACRPS